MADNVKTTPSAAGELCDNDTKRTKGQLTVRLQQERRAPVLEVGVGEQATNHFLSVVLHVTLPLRDTDLLIYFLYFYFHKRFTRYVEMRQHKGIFSVVIYRKKNELITNKISTSL